MKQRKYNLQRPYVRDGRAPIPKSAITSKVMRAIRPQNTGPERALRKALTANNLKGYRLNWKIVPGKPDICYPGKKIAVFVHGCFWHRCPYCKLPKPKTHSGFWNEKFRRNIARDRKNEKTLKSLGWSVIVCWDCQLKNNMKLCINKIRSAMKGKANR